MRALGILAAATLNAVELEAAITEIQRRTTSRSASICEPTRRRQTMIDR